MSENTNTCHHRTTTHQSLLVHLPLLLLLRVARVNQRDHLSHCLRKRSAHRQHPHCELLREIVKLAADEFTSQMLVSMLQQQLLCTHSRHTRRQEASFTLLTEASSAMDSDAAEVRVQFVTKQTKCVGRA